MLMQESVHHADIYYQTTASYVIMVLAAEITSAVMAAAHTPD